MMALHTAASLPLTGTQFRPLTLVSAAGQIRQSDQPRTTFASVLDGEAKRLDQKASAADPEQLRQAARDVEGVFLNLMCQEMMRTVGRGNGSFLPGGLAGDVYTGFLTQAYAGEMAKAGGIGLATLITGQLEK